MYRPLSLTHPGPRRHHLRGPKAPSKTDRRTPSTATSTNGTPTPRVLDTPCPQGDGGDGEDVDEDYSGECGGVTSVTLPSMVRRTGRSTVVMFISRTFTIGFSRPNNS